MTAQEMRARIAALLTEFRVSADLARTVPYLPEIIASLEAMLDNLEAPREARARMAGALGYLLLDDFAFAETGLGRAVLKLADDFASF